MVRRLLAVFVLAMVPIIAIPTALAPGAGAVPPGPIQGCMNGGWQTLSEASGQPFANQGQCIAYAIHHPVSLADLAKSSAFAGTTIFLPTNGCYAGSQDFDASYAGSPNVGLVVLHMAGCLNNGTTTVLSFSGSFTITTNVGTLMGTASGPIAFEGASLSLLFYQLTLGVQSGTGLLAGTAGNLQFETLLGVPRGVPPFLSMFFGTVSVP